MRQDCVRLVFRIRPSLVERVGRRARRAVTILAAVAAVGASATGCTSGQLDGQSPSYLMIDSLDAASGAQNQQFSNYLQSDVVTKGGILEDPGRVTFRLGLKDPGSLDSPAEPSTMNFITVNRYHVRFVRSDGRNTPGVDVPYPFDGAMTVTANGGGGSGSFVLVRVQSKLESPLMALRGLGGAIAISTLAEVTFYGQDQAGRAVSATGQISVNFADWADPE